MRLVLLLLAALLSWNGDAHALSSAVQRTAVLQAPPPFNWYADSVLGSDSNDCRKATTPCATIASIQTKINANQGKKKIGLARNSVWREQLGDVSGGASQLPSGVVVMAYGSAAGARPELRADDVITAGSWTKTGGFTNVYQAAISPVAAVTAYVTFFENDVYFKYVTTQALVDSTASSYTLSLGHTSGAQTVYIHTSDGSDPATNGKTYEYAKRLYGLAAYAGKALVDGIKTRRNHQNDGSMVVGLGSTIRNSFFWQGHKHNAFANGNSTWINIIAQDAYKHDEGGTLIVNFDQDPTGHYFSVSNSQFIQTVNIAGMLGPIPAYAHGNTGGARWTYGEYLNITVTGTGSTGFGGIDAAGIDNQVLSNSTFTDTTNMITGSATTLTSVVGGQFKSSVSGQRAIVLSASQPVSITGTKFCTSAGTISGAIVYGGFASTGLNVTISNVTAKTSTGSPFVEGGTGSISVNNSILDNYFPFYNVGDGATPGTITADNNGFNQTLYRWTKDGVTSNSLAAWRTASGQDTNSSIGVSGAAACN